MSKIYYPVIFFKDDNGYSCSVPDLPGCFSCGETLAEANEMVQDAIGLYLDGMSEIPAPTDPQKLSLEEGEFAMLVPFDSLAYARKYDTKAVKKTLTIPSWLNHLAEEEHVNFSSVLQSALKQHLHIK